MPLSAPDIARVVSSDQWYEAGDAKYVIVLRGLTEYKPDRTDGRKYLMWNISHPGSVSIEEYNAYDHVFFASEKMKNALESRICPPCSVLQQCADAEAMTYVETDGYRYELLFVGNSRGVYRKILKDLLPTMRHLTVYGDGWKKYLLVRRHVAGDYLAHERLGQAYHDAKIVLNDHWGDMREAGIVSNRIFDALCAGAFVISDDLPEIRELFGNSVATYRNRREFRRLIDLYLSDEEKRKECIRKGQSIVLTAHTFDDRIRQIAEVMKTL